MSKLDIYNVMELCNSDTYDRKIDEYRDILQQIDDVLCRLRDIESDKNFSTFIRLFGGSDNLFRLDELNTEMASMIAEEGVLCTRLSEMLSYYKDFNRLYSLRDVMRTAGYRVVSLLFLCDERVAKELLHEVLGNEIDGLSPDSVTDNYNELKKKLLNRATDQHSFRQVFSKDADDNLEYEINCIINEVSAYNSTKEMHRYIKHLQDTNEFIFDNDILDKLGAITGRVNSHSLEGKTAYISVLTQYLKSL